MKRLPQLCPHFTDEHYSLLDMKAIDRKNTCAHCQYNGTNLWICMFHNCMEIGCSEQANDHSTEHFIHSKEKQLHCIHMNLSSQRVWCYICERELSTHSVDRRVQSDRLLGNMACSSDNTDSNLVANVMSTGLVGLQNIANTCYMNSALQALSNIVPMTHYFLHCSDIIDFTLEQGAHKCKAGLAKSYQRLMCDIWHKKQDGKSILAPRGILYGIRSVHPMFRGFQQHDSQEFLRCFMDQLHEELKEQSGKLDDRLLQQSLMERDTDHEDTPSEISSTYSSNSLASDYITCGSSVSEESSLCEETINFKSNLLANSNLTTNRNAERGNPTPIVGSSAMRSIVSDIFDGKLLSSVQCLTCDRISTREETFQDLSLAIPNRDFLTALHQTNSISVQSLNSIDSTSTTRSNDNWISWLWNIIRSWVWGPSVTLHDCMANFFSADELKGDNMYSCEKCNKLRTGIKYSRILKLPEVLCIHLKRFRHDLSYSSKISSQVEFPLENFDMRPYIHKDCKSLVPQYNLSSVICHHGTVGGGHYTCLARNALTGRWYEFNDHKVSEVQPDMVQNCQAYVLFYHKTNPQIEHVRFEANELSVSYPLSQSDIRFYISREWLVRFTTFSEPGPISNWSMLCPHGGILHSKISIISHLAVPISQKLWEFLYEKFGGGPAINMLFECEDCKRTAQNLAHRQHYEYSVFQRYNDSELNSAAIYAVSMSWFRKWQQFARGLTHKEPGQINNVNIVMPSKDCGQKNSPVRSVRIGSDYVQINAPSWRFLHDIYGGGPEVLLRPALMEEIVIIDQDEFDESDSHTGNISDTESNLGVYDYNFTESLNANTSVKSNINDKVCDVNKIYLTKNNRKRQKIKEKSSIKIYSRGTHVSRRHLFSKKTKNKGNQDFVGLQGKYISKDNVTHSRDCEKQLHENSHKDIEEDKCINFGNNCKKSFRNEKRHQANQRKATTAIYTSSLNKTSISDIRPLHTKRNKKTKNLVVLKNVHQLQETANSDSNETDA